MFLEHNFGNNRVSPERVFEVGSDVGHDSSRNELRFSKMKLDLLKAAHPIAPES